MKNTNNKKPKLIAIIIVALVLVLAIGVGIWASGIQSNPEPSDPTGSSGTTGQTDGTDGTEPSNTDGTEPSGSDASDPTESGSSDGNETTPSGEPTDPSGSQPEATTPTETQPQATAPTETQPAETDPTEGDSSDGGETAPTDAPTEAPTQKPTEPPVTEPPTEPKPTEPAITWEQVNETVYATGNVNVRTGPSTSYDKLGQLKTGEAVKRVAIGSNGWSKVEYNGKEAYISSNYLTREEPVKPTDPPATEPKPTDPLATEPDEEETYIMYVITETAYRLGPGTEYQAVETMPVGTPMLVVKGSEMNGWVRIFNAGDYYYMLKSCLSETRPGSETEPTKDPDDPWSNYVQPADPETGISWDGVSPIIYTYADGTTGTEPQDGAKYEEMPGLWVGINFPKDGAGRPAGDTCATCGKVIVTGSNTSPDACYHYASSQYCSHCGKWTEANTCHTCVEYEMGDTLYCSDCGKVAGNGTNGTCVVWMTGGANRTCEFCGKPCPAFTCHTCDED